jgi:integrase
MREGLDIDQNPVIGTNRPPEPQSRDRVLSDSDIADVWAACGDDDYGRIIKLLLLTGSRREEIGGLAWAEIETDRATITLASSRTKNGRPHVIPLASQTLSIIKEIAPRDGRLHVFGDGPRVEGGAHHGFSGWSKAKKALDDRIQASRSACDKRKKNSAQPITSWRLHDLRRTCATTMADRLGILPHVIETALNHVSGHKSGVAGVYNHARYEREVRAALELWAEHVVSIVRTQKSASKQGD